MKHSIILTCILLCTFLASQAQIKPAVLSDEPANSDEHLEKNAINLLVMAKFHEEHPGISNESWIKAKDNGYQVNFTSNGTFCRAYLDKKGKIITKVRYCSEKELPTNVRNILQGFNSCFTINSVQEITSRLGTAYLVVTSNETSWKIIRVVDDEPDVYQEFKKG